MKEKLLQQLIRVVFIFTLCIIGISFSNAQTTITSWTYDPLNGTSTSPTPNIGSGTSTVVNLATTPITATGLSSTTGCGAGNSGLAWQHPNFNPGSSNEVNGVQFKAGTTGYNNIIFTWDLRFSNTSPNTVRLQYTTDGSTWNNFTMTGSNTTYCLGSINTNGCYETNTGDSYRRIRVDFTSITAANNNANFGVRLLASYYQSSGQYRQSTTPATVATTTGTWRFDNVSFLGTPTSTGAVISGSTSICSGGSANINVTITGGTSPFQVVYNDGTSNTTLSNYISGSNISVSPTSTKTYTLVSVTSSNGSGATVTPLTGSAVVTVTAGSSPTFTSSASTNSCASTDIVYTTQSGMDNYSWSFLKGASAAVLNTDYIVTAGSTSTETVTIQWVLASGTATFSASVTYNSCSGASVTSSTTVYALPSTPTWTAQPSGNVCTNASQTYTTANNKSNYVWNLPGVAGTDYTIVSTLINVPSVGTSGGTTIGTNTYSITLTWQTAGSKTVTVNYSNQASPNCQSATSLSNTITVLSPPVISSFGPTAAQVICTGGTFSPLTVVATGSGTLTYTWIRKNPGNIPTGYTGTTAAFQTYTPTLAASAGYFVTVNNGACTTVSSSPTGAFTISATAASVGGTVSGSATVCTSTANTSLSLSGNTGSVIYWQSTTDATFATGVSNISNTTTSLTATGVTTTTYYRAVVQNSTCPTSNSATGNVTVPTATWNGSGWTNGPPSSSKLVVFTGPYTSAGSGSGDLAACSLYVNSNVNVVATAGDTFTVQNEVVVASSPASLTFQDTSSLIQVNSSASINSGNIIYYRNSQPMRQLDYTYWSSPVSGQTISSFSSPSISYLWDTSIYNWSYQASSTTMSPAIGYIIRAPDTAPFTTTTFNTFSGVFTGTPNNGNFTTPVAISGSNDMNLLGNPYPSAIDANAFLNANKVSNGGNLSGTIFYWTHNTPFSGTVYANNDYASYNLTGGVATAAGSNPCSNCNSSQPNGKIGAGQAFFIQALSNGNAKFDNTMRFGTNTQFYRQATTSERHRYWLDIYNDQGLFKELLIGYLTDATNEFDTAFDGPSVDAGNPINIYSILPNAKKLTIQGRALPFDEQDIIPLGYKAASSGTFTINLSNYDGLFTTQDVYLEDTLQNNYVNLKNGAYTFATEAGTFDNRFKIHYVNTALSSPAFSASSIIVFQNNGKTTINSGTKEMKEVTLMDIQGRVITTFSNLTTSEYSFQNRFAEQIILVKITLTDGAIFYKKVLVK